VRPDRQPARDVPGWKLDYQTSALEFPFYEPEQVYALARAAANQQDGAIYVTAALSGLRLGELLGLQVRDVDFVGETIRVLRSIDIQAQFGASGRRPCSHGTPASASRVGLVGLSEEDAERVGEELRRVQDPRPDSVARMARFGVRSGSVAFARLDGSPCKKQLERTGANGRSHLSCRSSTVRVPSSAS